MFQNSCVSRLCNNASCNFVRLYQYQTNNFSAQRSNFHSAGVAKTESTESAESGESTDSSDSMFQNSCVSRLCGTVRCNFVRLNKIFPFLSHLSQTSHENQNFFSKLSHNLSTPPRVAILCIVNCELCILRNRLQSVTKF